MDGFGEKGYVKNENFSGDDKKITSKLTRRKYKE